jgi:sugar phosphate isomerase/epimerase
MFDVRKNLAVQSWCLRNFKTHEQVIAQVKALNLRRIEICAVHANFGDTSKFAEIAAVYRKAGVKIASIGVEGFGPDEAAARARFEFAKMAGCRVISATFRPATFLATLPVVYPLCEEYGINLAIHNHGGYDWMGNGTILDWVFSITRPCIGLNMDTGWALDARQDPLKWAERYAARLYAVHIKDFVYDRAGKPTDVVVGSGNLDLPKLMRTLKANGFKGEYIIESEGSPDNPLPTLREGIANIRKAG